DKATVLIGLLLMVGGGLIMAFTPSWTGQIAGRLISGTGGVFLNVLMTKMVTDWFAGREIATAMATFVNSWPLGVALSLLVLPVIGAGFGVGIVYLAVAVLIALCAVLLLQGYESPPGLPAQTATSNTRNTLDRHALFAVIIAGLIWGLY